MSIWGELRRRNVVRVGIAYVVVAWLVVQVADTIFPALQLPEWTVTFVAALLLLGFPVALVLSWAYELTPDGLKKSSDVAPAESITPATGRKIDRIIITVLALAVVFLVVDNYLVDREDVPVVAASESLPEPAASANLNAGPSVAVLPFDNLSSDDDFEYLSDGISLELRDQLFNAEALYVAPREHVLPFKGSTDSQASIAARLGVEHILVGSIQRAGDTVRISASLVRPADGSRVWNDSYDGRVEEVLNFQSAIAQAVIEELTGAFDAEVIDVFAGGTENEAAYDLYLRALARRQPREQADLLQEALTLDPGFALAQIRLAETLLSRARALGAGGAEEPLRRAERAVQRAVDIAPNLPETQLLVGQKNLDIGQFLAAEQALLAAIEQSGARDSRAFWRYGQFLLIVGRLRDAIPHLERARGLAPLSANPSIFLAMVYDALRDDARSDELQRDSDPLFSGLGGLRYGPAFWRHAYRGQIDEAARYAELGFGRNADNAVLFLTDAEAALTQVREWYEAPEAQVGGQQQFVTLFATLHGDVDLAVNAWRKTLQSTNAFMIFHWMPIMTPVRSHPDFKDALREAGFVEYWQQAGWPDQCSPVGVDDFECN